MNSSTMNESSISHTSRISDHIEIMQNLLQEILYIQKENKDVDTGMQRVQEIIVESNRVVENSISPSEMIVDAKILHTGTSLVNSNVTSLNTNLTSFSEPKYISGIRAYIENSDQILLVGKEWECLAPATYHLFKKSHSFTFMLGTFKLEPIQRKEKVRVERQKKAPEPQKTSLVEQKKQDKSSEERSDIYDHILKWLVRNYKKNDKKPINYFNFVINPHDYWRTIENIFYFAFLVRDGSVKMFLRDGLPHIEPVLKPTDGKGHNQTSNYQFCFSLSMPEWRKCIKKFGIRKPSIPSFVTSSSN